MYGESPPGAEASPGPVAAAGEGRGGPADRLSSVLRAVAEAAPGDRVGLGDLVDAFGTRAFGALIAVLAAPNVLPIAVPGISAVFGAPLLLLTVQVMLGRSKPWLPAMIRNRSLALGDFRAIVARIEPGLLRIERMVRPRLLGVTAPASVRLVGAFGVVLSLVLFLPIPLGNALPGLGLVLMALGALERDGVVVLAGIAVGAAGLAVVSGVVYAMALAAMLLVEQLFGM